jgi:hypothetical protein
MFETMLENPRVGGSIPPRATKNSVKHNANPCRLAFLLVDSTVLVSGLFPGSAGSNSSLERHRPALTALSQLRSPLL